MQATFFLIENANNFLQDVIGYFEERGVGKRGQLLKYEKYRK